MTERVTDDLLSPEAVRDPYAYFGRLREEVPVHYNERYRSWVITRYEHIVEAFKDPRFSSDRITPFLEQKSEEIERVGMTETFEVLADWLVFKDPPDHTRLRRLVHRAFTPRAVQRMQDRVELLARQLLEELPVEGEVDLIEDFAYPIPAIVIAEMLGVPPSDRELFKRWSDDISALVFGGLEDPGRYERAASGMLELVTYLNTLIDRYASEPEDNLISALVQAQEHGDSLTPAEVVATCTLLLFGGHETTTNLIGNGLLALMQHPKQLHYLREHPQDLRGAVEEFLRYDGPAKAVVRAIAEDVELDGHRLRTGDRVFLVPAAGNRDPRAFREPDRLDVARDGPQHLGFGLGMHYCLGAPLARLEGSLAIGEVLRQFESFELATDDLSWQPVLLSRGLEKLPVRFRKMGGAA